MRILVQEFVTGGGWYALDSGEPFPPSLLAEGAAMVEALGHSHKTVVRPPQNGALLPKPIAGRFALLEAGYRGAGAGWMYGDFSYDGVVDSYDFALTEAGWIGGLNGAASPPEPATPATPVAAPSASAAPENQKPASPGR